MRGFDTSERLVPRNVEVVDDAIADILRRKRPEDRLRIGFELWVSAHNMLMTHIRHSRPEFDEKAVEREVARRFLSGTL